MDTTASNSACRESTHCLAVFQLISSIGAGGSSWLVVCVVACRRAAGVARPQQQFIAYSISLSRDVPAVGCYLTRMPVHSVKVGLSIPQVESKFIFSADEEGTHSQLSWYTTMLVYKAADASTSYYLLTRESFHFATHTLALYKFPIILEAM